MFQCSSLLAIPPEDFIRQYSFTLYEQGKKVNPGKAYYYKDEEEDEEERLSWLSRLRLAATAPACC